MISLEADYFELFVLIISIMLLPSFILIIIAFLIRKKSDRWAKILLLIAILLPIIGFGICRTM